MLYSGKLSAWGHLGDKDVDKRCFPRWVQKNPVLSRHVKTCRRKRCSPCQVFEILASPKLPPWARRRPDDEKSASWIEYHWPDPSEVASFQFGCSVCESGSWATISHSQNSGLCTIWQLRRHSRGFHHMMALSKSMDKAKALALINGKVVPDKTSFLNEIR